MEVKNLINKKIENFVHRINLSSVQSFFGVNLFRNHIPSLNNDENQNSQQSPPPFSLISNFESQLIALQGILIWEKPRDSILALIFFTCFYWMFVLLQPRLISVVATLAFCYHFYEMWIRFVWPEIRAPTVPIKESWTTVNPNVMCVPEIRLCFARIKKSIINVIERIIEFRRKSHGIFCCYSVLFFLCFYYIGHFIPGVLITYLTAIILFLTPGFLAHIAPKNTLTTIVFNNNGDDEHYQNEGQQLNDDNNDEHQLQQLKNISSKYSNNLNDNNLELLSSTTSKKNLLFGFMINDDDDDDETNENHFDESTSESITDSDFVLISDSELNDM
uniref:Uncharacterized protein LOC113792867 n=1 Tax=Dermatophagoides pteronyssinus TaxID=6956 RepID=A0A6P6Y0K3_DERPT|nr:uncharacterized protein LOC113792867 [Dermatophagoides pteronyssinus]